MAALTDRRKPFRRGLAGECRTGTVEIGVEQLFLRVRRVAVPSCRVRLPYFDQHVTERRARPVDDLAFDADALSLRFRRDQHGGEILLEDIESRLLGGKTDLNVGTRGLGRGLPEIRAGRQHQFSPWSRFSKSVARVPRSTAPGSCSDSDISSHVGADSAGAGPVAPRHRMAARPRTWCGFPVTRSSTRDRRRPSSTRALDRLPRWPPRMRLNTNRPATARTIQSRFCDKNASMCMYLLSGEDAIARSVDVCSTRQPHRIHSGAADRCPA